MMPARMRHLVLLAALFGVRGIAEAQPHDVVVDDPRPVAAAMAALEARFGWPITYEDPRYLHHAQIADVTAAVRKDFRVGGRVLVPRGGVLSFSYDVPARKDASGQAGIGSAMVARAIARALEAHAAAQGVQAFSVLERSGRFHVVPTRFLDEAGRLQHATSLLDTPVAVMPAQRTGADLLEEICRSLSWATGETVILGVTPRRALSGTTAVATDNEPARTVLGRLFSELPEDLSWQLFYDPGLRWYVLNIHVVQATVR